MSPLNTADLTDLAERRLARIDAELDRRFELCARIEREGAQALALEQYAARPLEWMDDWLWSYDPRNADQGLPVYVPTLLTPKQREWVEWVYARRAVQEDGWAPKGRGVGASYMACAISLHGWLFEDGFSATLLSEKRDSLDKLSDPSTLFQKLRIILENLPKWMMPPGFDWDTHDNHRRLINPSNGSIITGAIGKSPGRGGRCTVAFVDEAAHIPDLTEVRRALRDNTNCTIEISTYNGTGEPFYQTSSAAPASQVYKLTWQDLPELYDNAWYERKKQQYADDPAGLAQEVDADPTAAVEDLCIPYKWAKACVGFDHPEAELQGGDLLAGLDVGGGKALNVLAPRAGNAILPLKRRSEGNVSLTAMWAKEWCEEHGATVLLYDGHGLGSGVGDQLALDRQAFRVVAFMAGQPATEEVWPNKKTSRERFRNLKAEMWWRLRERCRKSFETREGIHIHPADECLRLPDDETLLTQLATPKMLRGGDGRMILERKDQLARRGVSSPDEADAVVMTEAYAWIVPRFEWSF